MRRIILFASALFALVFFVSRADAQLALRTNSSGVYQTIKVYKFPDPGAGVGVAIVAPPAGFCWRIITAHWHYLTSGSAGNREAIVTFQDSNGEIYSVTGPNYIQVAGLTISYMLVGGYGPSLLTATAPGVHRTLPIPPDIWIGGGGTASMVLSMVGVLAGDAITDLNIEVEQRACLGTL